MNISRIAATLTFFAMLTAGVGCIPSPTHHVTSRGVISATSGGQGEVWLVMSEVTGDVKKDSTILRSDDYIVYHCVPAGCKRVGEITGVNVKTQVTK